MTDKPQIRVTVFSDYICPFCYIGDARLQRLREEFDLKVNWCFLEIHPETPAEGQPVSALGYPSASWERMMATLMEMAREDGLVLREHDFTTCSRSALQLAEAAKFIDPVLFYRLHEALFRAFFVEGENIGSAEVLEELALAAGLSQSQFETALHDRDAAARLRQYRRAAQELGVQATPTFFIGERRLDGAVPVEELRAAARAAA